MAHGVALRGRQVTLFGMYVHEYGYECLPPNAGRAYVQCIDSTPLYGPEQVRPAPPCRLSTSPCGTKCARAGARTRAGCGTAHAPLQAVSQRAEDRRGAASDSRRAHRVSDWPAAAQGDERQEILTAIVSGYFEYAREVGFKHVHLHVPPPTDECAFIFTSRSINVRIRACMHLAHW